MRRDGRFVPYAGGIVRLSLNGLLELLSECRELLLQFGNFFLQGRNFIFQARDTLAIGAL